MTDWDIDSIRYRFPSLRRPGPDERARGVARQRRRHADRRYLPARHQRLPAQQQRQPWWPTRPASRPTSWCTTSALATADLLGATDADEVSFGANMTTITFAISRAIGATLQPGDEIVVTKARPRRQRGAVAGRRPGARPRRARGRLASEDAHPGPGRPGGGPRPSHTPRRGGPGLQRHRHHQPGPAHRQAGPRGRCAALRRCRPRGAAPVAIDVHALGADYLVCSAYKFYGPHVGVLWGRRELLEALPPYHVRPAGDVIPGRFETGTRPTSCWPVWAVPCAYLEKVGITQGGAPGLPGQGDRLRRPRLLAAISAIRRYESALGRQLHRTCQRGARASASTGITDPARGRRTLPHRGLHVRRVTRRRRSPASSASAASTCATATTTPGSCTRALGLAESGGTVRVEPRALQHARGDRAPGQRPLELISA